MQAKKIFRNIIIAILSITIYNIYAINNTYADDTITITLPSSSVNLPITPTSSGVFNSTDINVQVTTSNTAGYTLSMTAADVNLTRTAAVNGTTPTIPTFTSLSGYTSGTTYSQANFPTGYWGYKLSSDVNYSPLASSITIADPDESTANTAISNVITFAAKLDNSKPAGSYTTTLTFTATGKTPPVSIISIDYDITLPSAAHVILGSGNDTMMGGSYYDLLADLGTGTHFTGTLQIEETALDLTVTSRNFAVSYSEFAKNPSCTVGGDITISYCGNITKASYFKVLGSGSIVVTVPKWD